MPARKYRRVEIELSETKKGATRFVRKVLTFERSLASLAVAEQTKLLRLIVPALSGASPGLLELIQPSEN